MFGLSHLLAYEERLGAAIVQGSARTSSTNHNVRLLQPYLKRCLVVVEWSVGIPHVQCFVN
jgi:hypothetical protein